MNDFEEIYKTYYALTYHYVMGLSKDAVLAEEITQETFFKVLKKIDTFQGGCKLSVWICQIAKNTFYNYCRKKHIDPESVLSQLPSGEDLEKSLIDKDMAMRIHEILHRTPEPYREVFWMRTFGDLSFAEIGKLHQKSESWARVIYHRAKIKIKEELE